MAPSSDYSDNEDPLARAYETLYQDIDAIDSDTGKACKKRVKTPLYETYLDRQSVYHETCLTYHKAYRKAQNTDSERGMWPMVAPTLQFPVRTAYKRWRTGGADQVEQALSIINNAVGFGIS